ncbi:MAG: PAS domain S-box protein [Leptolyngbya sp. RL_3_1]|nr:PAS domain S-box protein [Leptolyngbya sp. RL_3_1]
MVGLLTERDMVRLMAQSSSLATLSVETGMHSPVVTLRVSELIDSAVVQSRLQQCRYPLLVLDADGGLVGLLTGESWDAALARRQNKPWQDPSIDSRQVVQSCTRLVMAAPVGIFRHDANDNCIYVNDCYCQLTGLTPETARGDQWQTHLHPEDRDRVVAAWGQFVQAQVPFNLEYRYQQTDGTIKWVYSQALIEQDNQGQVVGYIGTITDISDRKQAEIKRQQAEQALAQSEAQSRAMLAAIPDLLFRVGFDGVYRGYVSPNRELEIVPNEADLVGRSIHDVLLPELADQQLNAVRVAIQTGELQVYEQQVQLACCLQDEEVRVIKNGDDEALLIIRDITERARLEAERKRAEDQRTLAQAALVQSEARNQAIIAALPDYLFCVGADGLYRDVVTYKPEITLFPAEFDPVGLSMTDVLPADVARKQLNYLAETLQTGTLHTYEQQIQIGDQVRDEEVRVVKSGPDEALFMVRDISERARLEAERQQAEQQLQTLIEGTAATTGQDFFPALVSHIAQALQVSYALVTEQVGSELRTLGFWANGALQPTYLYGIAHTPVNRSWHRGNSTTQTPCKAVFRKTLTWLTYRPRVIWAWCSPVVTAR